VRVTSSRNLADLHVFHTHTHTHKTHEHRHLCYNRRSQSIFPAANIDIQNKLKMLTDVVQGMDRQRAFVSKVINLRVP